MSKHLITELRKLASDHVWDERCRQAIFHAAGEIERLLTEIHRLRGRLSHYEQLEPWP